MTLHLMGWLVSVEGLNRVMRGVRTWGVVVSVKRVNEGAAWSRGLSLSWVSSEG